MESPIFIFGQARSGSTLVQRLINSTGEAVICGEHLKLLSGIAGSYYTFFDHPALKTNPLFTSETPVEDLRRGEDFLACATNFTADTLADNYRTFVRNTVDTYNHPRWGFKEIHYGLGDRVFPFLHTLFPTALFVFLVRNPYDQLQSKVSSVGWWPAEGFERSVYMWMTQVRYYQQYASTHDRTMLVRYEDFVQQPAPVFDFLRLPWTQRQSDLLNGNKAGATKNKVPLTDYQLQIISSQCQSLLYPVDGQPVPR